jgi:hypothetical protein
MILTVGLQVHNCLIGTVPFLFSFDYRWALGGKRRLAPLHLEHYFKFALPCWCWTLPGIVAASVVGRCVFMQMYCASRDRRRERVTLFLYTRLQVTALAPEDCQVPRNKMVDHTVVEGSSSCWIASARLSQLRRDTRRPRLFPFHPELFATTERE